LLEEYERHGIEGAALSPAEAVLQPEPMRANRGLFVLLTGVPAPFRARAVPVLNPLLPAWPEHLAACRQEGGALVRAIKIVPAYHDYALDHPSVEALAARCLESGLGLCLQVRMEDERMHHPRMRVDPVPARAVADFARRWADLSILVCSGYMAELAAYRDCPNLQAELSFVESGFTLRDAISRMGSERLLVGTHTPIHMVAPNAAKLTADDLDADAQQRIGSGNFARFFGG
jgi:hypothetical protein